MVTPEGAFAASLDADSEGQEGKFYVWTLAEIEAVLGAADAAYFAAQYDVTPEGNFEGHNILNRLNRLASYPESDPVDIAASHRLALLRGKLLEQREKRVRPGLDDKILADWNGLMIAALANGGAMLGETEWIAMAARAFGFVAPSMAKGEELGHRLGHRLGHSWRAGKLLYPGLASDFACMIKAALASTRPQVSAAISIRRSPGRGRSTGIMPTRTTTAIS